MSGLTSIGRFLWKHLALIIIMVSVAGWLNSEAARGFHERQAKDYRSLYTRERLAHRHTIQTQRIIDIEERLTAAHDMRNTPRDYQAHIADLRQRFAVVVRDKATACPVPVRVAPAPARTDAPAPKCPDNSQARQVADQLRALQDWVRANTGGGQ